MDSILPSESRRPPLSKSLWTRNDVVAFAGNPNSGKTTLFNGLTGLHHKVGNYPGVTVERITGVTQLVGIGEVTLLDLPGCYSLRARSEDERITRDTLMGLDPSLPRPKAVVVVLDAAHLVRSLFLFSQIAETGLPLLVALNQVDVLAKEGRSMDHEQLGRILKVPVIPTSARQLVGLDALKEAIPLARAVKRPFSFPAGVERAIQSVATSLHGTSSLPQELHDAEALRLLSQAKDQDAYLLRAGALVQESLAGAKTSLRSEGVDPESFDAEARYSWAQSVEAQVMGATSSTAVRASERVDRVLLHRFFGPPIFLLVMGALFQSVYSWAEPFMGAIESLTGWLQELAIQVLPEGTLTDLIVDGVIAGVGNVLVFLPQIAILFLLLTILEDLGYLARAAFLIDRCMRVVGLQGRSFVPLMSSFACAIPGIMAARTIENRRDRMVTILIAPFMSCSARLPVYALLIGAFVPAAYGGVTLLALYMLSILAGLLAALILRKTLFRGEDAPFLMELPDYRMPSFRNVLQSVLHRTGVFVKQAGTIILTISIILWALLYFPRNEAIVREAEQRIAAGEEPSAVALWQQTTTTEQSFAGQLGRTIEPLIEPLGYDWRIGIGLIASFAAREVMVSSLAIIYSVGEEDDEDERPGLRQRLQEARRPDGSHAFTLATALSLMVFFVLASQCMATLAVVKRETNSWRWALFMFSFMTVAAWIGAFVTYQVASRI
jgi:ferrous iron transport protein B